MEKLLKLLCFLFILEVAFAIHEYGHFREMRNIIYAPVRFIIVGTQYLLNLVTFGAVSIKNPRSFIFDGVKAPTFIEFVELNLLLALWNILPITPLDGGRIFNDLAIFVLPSNVLSVWNKMGIYFLFALFFFGGTKLRIIKRNDDK